jgi:malate dehydrogenase (oxaloacetate-decarboxylating)
MSRAILALDQTASEAARSGFTGHRLLDHPLLNEGSAFTESDRQRLGLLGLLPYHCSTLDEQLVRVYGNYQRKSNDLERYIFLTALQDRNETLFYRLLQKHITEMMPIIYTPTVGEGCRRYSHVFRRPRGLYISYPYRDQIAALLDNAPNPTVDVIVVTDGERILGLGDLGVGGMGIPVGKLSLYTLCAGIHPATTMPIMLDLGTDNRDLLNDPLYLGWRHERVRGQEYDDFIETFVQAVIKKFPNVLLQWEDFSKHNAPRILERYRDRLCTFNDDIQGTGAVTVAGLLAAAQVTKTKLSDHRLVILGAGSSAVGISDQIVAAMQLEGASHEAAKKSIWLIDSKGLVHDGRETDEPFKKKYAQPLARTAGWQLEKSSTISFIDVVRNVHPTILIGTSAQPGAFTEEVVREMAGHIERPIIFPLSNPTSKSEAIPKDIFAWTNDRALVATGSPFEPVTTARGTVRIGQCNNSFIFPGVGLGVIASGARRVTDEMFVAAARVLSSFAPALRDANAALYPELEQVRDISHRVALAVAVEAHNAGLASVPDLDLLAQKIEKRMWRPGY